MPRLVGADLGVRRKVLAANRIESSDENPIAVTRRLGGEKQVSAKPTLVAFADDPTYRNPSTIRLFLPSNTRH
jgi:hypothetical protein